MHADHRTDDEIVTRQMMDQAIAANNTTVTRLVAAFWVRHHTVAVPSHQIAAYLNVMYALEDTDANKVAIENELKRLRRAKYLRSRKSTGIGGKRQTLFEVNY